MSVCDGNPDLIDHDERPPEKSSAAPDAAPAVRNDLPARTVPGAGGCRADLHDIVMAFLCDVPRHPECER
jgi:hypothetical protein